MGCHELKVRALKIQQPVFCPEEKELTKAEYTRLCQTAARRHHERLNLILQTICGTGIRVSELKFITVEAARQGEVTVQGKAKTRVIFIVKELKQKLLRYAAKQGIQSGMIFITRGGKPLSRTNIWREMKSLCAEENVTPRKVFPHNLRHWFARVFYELEKDIAELADIFGHSRIHTTRIYIVATGTMTKLRKNGGFVLLLYAFSAIDIQALTGYITAGIAAQQPNRPSAVLRGSVKAAGNALGYLFGINRIGRLPFVGTIVPMEAHLTVRIGYTGHIGPPFPIDQTVDFPVGLFLPEVFTQQALRGKIFPGKTGRHTYFRKHQRQSEFGIGIEDIVQCRGIKHIPKNRRIIGMALKANTLNRYPLRQSILDIQIISTVSSVGFRKGSPHGFVGNQFIIREVLFG